MTTDFYEFCFRASFSVLLAGILGLERSLKNKPVGARTFMMVALGSACFTMITLNFADSTLVDREGAIGVDPTRVVQGIIGGIGFLGAGALMSNSSDNGMVRGMGTGSAIWCVGSIGIACAFGYLWEAGFVTALALAILTIAGWFENRVQDISEKITKDE